MPRYAAVDIGSNSVRLLVAETAPGSFAKTLAEARDVTRLGESVFRTGRISQEAMGLVCGVLAGMAQTYRQHDVIGARAVATAAVRDASNQQEFLDNASAAIGVPVEVISGAEEARLIHLGVLSTWPHPHERLLILDLGGGSAEMILSEAGELKAAYSKPVGAVRLTEVFLRNDPPTPLEVHQLDEYVHEKIAPAAKKIGAGSWDRVIGTSATAAAIVCAVNEIPRSKRESADRLPASFDQIESLARELSRKNLAARRRATGIGPRRAEIIIAGSLVFRRMMEDFGVGTLYYSNAGVRDGIIADLLERGVGRERSQLNRDQLLIVQAMARRFGVSVGHVGKVAELAHVLFNSLQPLHQLPPEYGRLLEAAAYLHDVGHYISDTAHHKHSAYIVANSELPGFTTQERKVIAHLCRYHRKAMPNPKHDSFLSLADQDKEVVIRLAPLLRLADSLDRSHQQRVEKLECHLHDGSVVVYLRSDADTDLDQWAAERAAEIFQQVYDRPLALVKTRE